MKNYNYTEWSNSDINRAVTCEVYNCFGWALSESGDSFFHCGADGSGYYVQQIIDYCNSWADAGPVILDNHIVLTPCMGKNEGDATGYFEHENPITIEFSSNDQALRAAMIVFLMMKDAEK